MMPGWENPKIRAKIEKIWKEAGIKPTKDDIDRFNKWWADEDSDLGDWEKDPMLEAMNRAIDPDWNDARPTSTFYR